MAGYLAGVRARRGVRFRVLSIARACVNLDIAVESTPHTRLAGARLICACAFPVSCISFSSLFLQAVHKNCLYIEKTEVTGETMHQ